LNEYGLRREAMISMLSSCDKVIAVSDFVSRLFRNMGVREDKLCTLTIGTQMAQLAAESVPLERLRAAAAQPDSPHLASGRVRLAFMGYNNYFKGLGMLIDSLELLPPDALANIELFVWAKDIEPDRPRLEALGARLWAVHVRDGYNYNDVPDMLCGIDAGLVPSVWWDNGPQTVMEFLACGVPVIGAAVGGIVDFVEEGKNGFLFEGNNRQALAGVLERIALYPQALREVRRQLMLGRSASGPAAVLTIAQHAARLEELYRQLQEQRKDL